jgi:ABC-type multidrug transport system ATPase subunit
MVSGEICVNGQCMNDDQYQSIIGYVDQEDTLMDTLTVYETILNSALLRLPRKMSTESKKRRVNETMEALGIMGIADRFIGRTGKRGISGGEKRRVSIACELVTSPVFLKFNNYLGHSVFR